jgi:MFS family permease
MSLLKGLCIAFTCVALVLIAFFTRYASLDPDSLHIDDAWVLLGWKADRWVDIQRAGSTSLGFVLMLRAWLGVVGSSYSDAQLLPFVISLFSAPAFLLVALRTRIRYPAALLGSAMLLASPTLVSYSTRVKHYSLEVLLAILLIGLAAAILRDPTARRAWIAYVLGSVVALVISFAVLGVVLAGLGAGLVALLRQEGIARLWRSCALACTISAALFAGGWFLTIIRPTLSTALRDFWSGFYLSDAVGRPNVAPWWHWTDTASSGLLAHDWKLLRFLFEGAFTGPTTVLLVGFVAATLLVGFRRPLHALLFGIPFVVAVGGSAAQVAPLGGGRTDAWLYAPMTFMIVSAVDVVLQWAHGAQRRGVGDARPNALVARGRGLVLSGIVSLIALLCLLNIPSPASFPWPDAEPLVRRLEAGRRSSDLVVVAPNFTFNYALQAPQHITTKVSTRNSTRFTPVLQGVNTMNWQDYPAPMREFDKRISRVRDVWLIDAPELIYPLGAAPRRVLTSRGFLLSSESKSSGGLLEHWHRSS